MIATGARDMKTSNRQTAAESAKQATVKSRETGKVYRVIREYKHTLMVTPAWRKHGYKMTMPKTDFYPYTHTN